MNELNFELQINNITYKPKRYKAVLMLNGGMSKALPYDSNKSIEQFVKESKETVSMYNGNLTIK